MDLRKKELLNLNSFTQNIEAEVTMLLQSLQWDRKRLLEGTSTATCQYDGHHRMPKDNLGAHETSCALRSMGYMENDELLPDPPDGEAHTLVKFSNSEIEKIINEASKMDPLFKKGAGGASHQPLSLARLQLVFTADERRALHDAVVAAVPSCHNLGDLALASSSEDAQRGSSTKSRVEILAELRNMKRRRAKYRVAAKTKNYSDVLRDVIRTQMESYTEAITSTSVKVEDTSKCNHGNNSDFDKNESRNNDVNNKFTKYDSVRSKDKSDDRRQDSVAEKRQYDVRHEERRYKEESRKESSSRRYEDRDRSDPRKRYESLAQRNHKSDDMSREGYKSRSEYSDKNEDRRHRTHDNRHRDKTRRVEEYDQRYTKDRNDKIEKGKKSHDYNESDNRYSGRRSTEDKYRVDKIKVERDERRRSRSYEQCDGNENRPSRDRHKRKRKHGDDYQSYGEQYDNTEYKRYYEIKKEPS